MKRHIKKFSEFINENNSEMKNDKTNEKQDFSDSLDLTKKAAKIINSKNLEDLTDSDKDTLRKYFNELNKIKPVHLSKSDEKRVKSELLKAIDSLEGKSNSEKLKVIKKIFVDNPGTDHNGSILTDPKISNFLYALN